MHARCLPNCATAQIKQLKTRSMRYWDIQGRHAKAIDVLCILFVCVASGMVWSEHAAQTCLYSRLAHAMLSDIDSSPLHCLWTHDPVSHSKCRQENSSPSESMSGAHSPMKEVYEIIGTCRHSQTPVEVSGSFRSGQSTALHLSGPSIVKSKTRSFGFDRALRALRHMTDFWENLELLPPIQNPYIPPPPFPLLPGAIDRGAVQPPFGGRPGRHGAAAKAPPVERVEGRAAGIEERGLLYTQQRLNPRHLLGRLIRVRLCQYLLRAHVMSHCIVAA